MLHRLLREVLKPALRAPDPIIQAGRLAASLMPGHSALDVLRAIHIARVVSLGETGRDLMPMRMESSAMGPMNERLYADLRSTIRITQAGRSHATKWERPLDEETQNAVHRACAMLAPLTSGQILSIVIRDGSAWARSWVPDDFSQTSISDPARWRQHQRSVWRGSRISLAAMRDDYDTFFLQPKAA